MQYKQQAISTKFENRIFSFFQNINFAIEDFTQQKCTPDFFYKEFGYIECTVTRRGESSDGLRAGPKKQMPVSESRTQTQNGFVASRLINRLQEKKNNFNKYIEGEKIDIKLPRTIFMTIDTKGFNQDYLWEDIWGDVWNMILYKIDSSGAVYYNGKLSPLIDRRPLLKPKSNLMKVTSVPLPTGLFCEKEYSCISAIVFLPPQIKRQQGDNNMYITYDVLNSESLVNYMAADMTLFLNPNASTPMSYKQVELLKKQGINCANIFQTSIQNEKE